jgi:hypothetical protein
LENERVQFYKQHLAVLKDARSNWDTQWEEAASRILPAHRNTFFGNPAQQGQEGQKKTELQFDSTASLAAHRFMSIIESLVSPQGSPWHLLRVLDKSLKKNRVVRQFFDDLNECLFDYRYRPVANFVSNSQQVYLGLGVYGNGALYIDRPDKQKGLRYRNIHIGEAYFVENHAGVVDTLYRVFPLDARQLMQKFPQTCPQEVREAAKQATQSGKKYNVLHAVHPREDFVPGFIGSRGMPYVSVYILIDTNDTPILQEGGYSSFPYAVARYTQSSGETYGRGPAQYVLPAIKTLNEQKKTVLKQGHRIVDPVLLSHDDSRLGSFSLRAGALNPGGVNKDGKPLVHVLPTGNIAVGEKMMMLEQETIKDAFLTTLFQILVESPQKTATEVIELAKEKGILLAPTAGRLEAEFLGPVLEREIDLLGQQGLLPPMPPILRQALVEYKIEYNSPLSRLRRMERVAGFSRSLSQAAEYTKMTGDPTPLDHFAFDRAMPEVLDISGAPVDWTRTPDEIEALRAGRAQQQQVQQLVDVAPALASVAK